MFCQPVHYTHTFLQHFYFLFHLLCTESSHRAAWMSVHSRIFSLFIIHNAFCVWWWVFRFFFLRSYMYMVHGYIATLSALPYFTVCAVLFCHRQIFFSCFHRFNAPCAFLCWCFLSACAESQSISNWKQLPARSCYFFYVYGLCVVLRWSLHKICVSLSPSRSLSHSVGRSMALKYL